MLSPIDDVQTGAAGTSLPAKTIAHQYYGGTYTLVYTVPANRVFEGFVWGSGTNRQQFIVPNGGTLVSNSGTTVSTQTTWPPYMSGYADAGASVKITLRAGDAVYSGTAANYDLRIFGEERDA
tara:strand:- start:3933 stop:4301 length:369 start_codon:yes stop_codon:yes gene_type:complete